jgi:peptidoglycan/xylan/chitin deacetylase (PgdA/CDA1 family)
MLTKTKHCLKHALLSAFAVKRKLGRGSENAVLLTFDDGPHPDVTPAVLERLRHYRARAVFFVVGNRIGRAPGMLDRILTEGHELGNHTYLHPLDRTPWLWPYVKDISRCQRLLQTLIGRKPRLFRPPLGRLSPASLVAPRILGLKSVLWSVDSHDWSLRNREDALRCGERLAASVGPGDLVLLHDDNPCVLDVLDVLLPALAAQGRDLHGGLSLL